MPVVLFLAWAAFAAICAGLLGWAVGRGRLAFAAVAAALAGGAAWIALAQERLADGAGIVAAVAVSTVLGVALVVLRRHARRGGR